MIFFYVLVLSGRLEAICSPLIPRFAFLALLMRGVGPARLNVAYRLMNNVEDEFLINYIVAMLEDTPKLDPRKMQVAVIGFIGKRRAGCNYAQKYYLMNRFLLITGIFMSELWTLLLDAQEHDGIPSAMIEQTRSELQKRRVRN